jgi:dTDP-4-dehydrorhamnose 3,5-epimerase
MIFTPTTIPDVFVIDIEPKEDVRGFFARTACVDEFAAHGLSFQLAQASVSWNARRGTLRGLHYQAAPHGETKIVRCTAGAIYDVALDVRPGSPACGHWIGVELSAANRRSLFLPEGVAHGFQTLADGSEVFYEMTARYHPEAARGVRWNDPKLAIAWPLPDIAFLSETDRALPDLATVMARATG